jgi:hypothetical protein
MPAKEQGTGRSTLTRQVWRGQFRHSWLQEYQDKSWCNGSSQSGWQSDAETMFELSEYRFVIASGTVKCRDSTMCRCSQTEPIVFAQTMSAVKRTDEERRELSDVLSAKVPPRLEDPSLALGKHWQGWQGAEG